MLNNLQSLDYVAVLVYLLLMVVMGILYGRAVKDSDSYFKGSGAIPWGMVAVTNFMGLFSTFVFVAYAGIAYQYGLVSVIVFWCTVPACIICGALFGGRWRRTGRTTPVEYLEMRYNISVRQVSSWLGLIMRFLDNIVRLYAIGVFVSAATPLSLGSAIIIVGILAILFNLFGGIWSVSIMSSVQFIILVIVTVILLPLSFGEVGGFHGIAQSLPDNMKLLNGPKGAPMWLMVYYLMVTIKYNGNWSFIQKFFCVRDEGAARKTGVVTGLLFFVFGPVFILPAVAAPLIVPHLDNPEMAYVALSTKLLPVGVMGIMFSSMIAATLSSLNSEYNVMSSVVTHDIYKRLFNRNASEKTLLRVARWSVLVIGTVMIAGAFAIQGMGGAFEANKIFAGIVAIPLAIPLVLGLVSKKPDSPAAILTIVVGIIIGIVINIVPSISWELGTLLEIILCVVVYYFPFRQARSEQRQKELDSLFHQLETPVAEEDKPSATPEYRRLTEFSFVLSFIVAGLLFLGMGAFSAASVGGRLGVISGIVCLAAALIIWLKLKIQKKSCQRT